MAHLLLRACFDQQYGVDVTLNMLNLLNRTSFVDKHVLVVGSEQPWLETIALTLGAAHVTTVEYGRINSTPLGHFFESLSLVMYWSLRRDHLIAMVLQTVLVMTNLSYLVHSIFTNCLPRTSSTRNHQALFHHCQHSHPPSFVSWSHS
jgi:hypothetical protein